MRPGECREFRYSDGVVIRWYNRKTVVIKNDDMVYIEFWKTVEPGDKESDGVEILRNRVKITRICISLKSAKYLSIALLETLNIKDNE